MHNIKILIADDEKPARKKIRSYLKELEQIEAIIEAENGIEAVEKIRKYKPDLVLLDIQMPDMTGFEVIETIGIENMPVVVFVTAYD
jgi:two-component system LytT family response regulator